MENFGYYSSQKISLFDFETIGNQLGFRIEMLGQPYQPRINFVYVDDNGTEKYWSIREYIPTPNIDGFSEGSIVRLKREIEYESGFDIEFSYNSSTEIIRFFQEVFRKYGGILSFESPADVDNWVFFNKKNLTNLSDFVQGRIEQQRLFFESAVKLTAPQSSEEDFLSRTKKADGDESLGVPLDVEEYEYITPFGKGGSPAENFEVFADILPKYQIAICPICNQGYFEKINTYTLQGWSRTYGKTLHNHPRNSLRCEHFVLVEPFIHMNGVWPSEARGLFGPEKPHVIGYLLQEHSCRGVMHSIPISRINENEFVPAYTLHSISYFSENPNEAYDAICSIMAESLGEYTTPMPFAVPPPGNEDWWELKKWVQNGTLFYLNENSNEFILSSDAEKFPYGGIEGRRISHVFPYPY